MASTGNATTTPGAINTQKYAYGYMYIMSHNFSDYWIKHLTAQGRLVDRCNTGCDHMKFILFGNHSANYYYLFKGFDFLLNGFAKGIKYGGNYTERLIYLFHHCRVFDRGHIYSVHVDAQVFWQDAILILCKSFHLFLFYFDFLNSY